MGSQIADFGTDVINRTAAAQMIACIKGVYTQRLDAIAPMLLPDGQVVDQHAETGTWPPSWFLARLGPGDYMIVMEGTTSPGAQGIWHAFGTWSYANQGRAQVNSQWAIVAGPIMARMLAASGEEPTGVRWRLSGHSYGGAVCQLLAESLVARFPAWNVQLMTVGQPRARTAGFAGPQVPVYWRMDSTGDPVPEIPPPGLYPEADPLPLLGFIRVSSMSWAQYGTEQRLQPTGVFSQGRIPIPDDAPDDISDSPFQAHGTQNYWARLRYHFVHSGGLPAERQALDIYAGLIGVPELPAAPALPADIMGAPNPQWFAPTIFPSPFPEVRTVAAPEYLPLADNGGNLIKMTTFLNIIDPGGETESIYLYSANQEVDNLVMATLLAAWNLNRRSIMTNAATLIGNRTSRVTPVKTRGRPWNDQNTINAGVGAQTGPRGVGNNCATWSVRDTSNTFSATYTTRFLPIAFITFGSGTARASAGFDPDLIAWKNAALALLRAPQNGSTPSGLRWALRVIDRREATAATMVIDRYLMSGANLAIDVEGAISGVIRGSKVLLHHNAQKCIVGLTGTPTVLFADPVVRPGFTRYTLNRGYCCDPTTLEKAIGTVRRLVYAAVPVGDITALALSTRATGRPSGARRGAQPKGCC